MMMMSDRTDMMRLALRGRGFGVSDRRKGNAIEQEATNQSLKALEVEVRSTSDTLSREQTKEHSLAVGRLELTAEYPRRDVTKLMSECLAQLLLRVGNLGSEVDGGDVRGSSACLHPVCARNQHLASRAGKPVSVWSSPLPASPPRRIPKLLVPLDLDSRGQTHARRFPRTINALSTTPASAKDGSVELDDELER